MITPGGLPTQSENGSCHITPGQRLLACPLRVLSPHLPCAYDRLRLRADRRTGSAAMNIVEESTVDVSDLGDGMAAAESTNETSQTFGRNRVDRLGYLLPRDRDLVHTLRVYFGILYRAARYSPTPEFLPLFLRNQ